MNRALGEKVLGRMVLIFGKKMRQIHLRKETYAGIGVVRRGEVICSMVNR